MTISPVYLLLHYYGGGGGNRSNLYTIHRGRYSCRKKNGGLFSKLRPAQQATSLAADSTSWLCCNRGVRHLLETGHKARQSNKYRYSKRWTKFFFPFFVFPAV